MKVIHRLLLSLLTGLLLALGWPEHGFPGLLFIGLIPMLLVEDDYWNRKSELRSRGLFVYSFLAFMVFNTLTTYWIYNSTLVGAIAAVLLNTLLMSGAFQLFHFTRRKMKQQGTGYLALIGYWLSYEYLHLRWDLNWPWLNFGHGFASWPQWIQWYEYTGVFGGSLWVLAVNILLARFVIIRLIRKVCNRAAAMSLAGSILVLVMPILLSWYMYRHYNEKNSPVDVVVVQPNLDPYSEQYEIDPLEVSERMLKLAASGADSLTGFIVFPESALQEYAFEDNLEQVGSIQQFRTFLSNYPAMTAIVGMSTRKLFAPGEPLSSTARKFRDADRYYDAYNTALLIAHDGSMQVHHKSKLTPGVEKMPYPRLFHSLEKYALDLGGTVGSLGVDKVQMPLKVKGDVRVAPIICYESVYGEFVNEFVRNGANIIFVITNDGWWGNSPGHRQHLLFSSLRAIETRRSIARSANTGISCFIDQRGVISQKTGYWQPEVIRATINTNDSLTFYVKYGDFIGRISLLVAALMFLLTISVSLIPSRNRNL